MATRTKSAAMSAAFALALASGAQAAPIFTFDFHSTPESHGAAPRWGMGLAQLRFQAAWAAALRHQAPGPAHGQSGIGRTVPRFSVPTLPHWRGGPSSQAGLGNPPSLGQDDPLPDCEEDDPLVEPDPPVIGNQAPPEDHGIPAVPEPGTLAMMGAGLLGLLAGRVLLGRKGPSGRAK